MILPFKQTDLYGGLAKLGGLLRVENNAVTLEYKVKDDLFEVFESDAKILKINHIAIEEVEVKKKWFSGRFIISLNQLPRGKHSLVINENVISLKIKKTDLEKARTLRSRLMLKLSEDKLRRIEQEELKEPTSAQAEKPFEFYTSKEDGGEESGLKNMLR